MDAVVVGVLQTERDGVCPAPRDLCDARESCGCVALAPVVASPACDGAVALERDGVASASRDLCDARESCGCGALALGVVSPACDGARSEERRVGKECGL